MSAIYTFFPTCIHRMHLSKLGLDHWIALHSSVKRGAMMKFVTLQVVYNRLKCAARREMKVHKGGRFLFV